MTGGDHLQPTVFLRVHMILDTLLQLLPLPCPIVKSTFLIHNCHVLNMDRAKSLQCMSQLPLQLMAQLTQGCHQYQPCANKRRHIVLNGGHINSLSIA